MLDLDALLSAQLVLLPIPEAMGDASLVSFSPSGRSAVLSGNGRLQVLTGLPEAPQVARSLNAGSEGIRLLAVSDDGQTVLAAGDGGVFAIGTDSAQPIASGDVSAMAFFPNSSDAVVCDRSTQSAMRVVAGSSVEMLAGPVDGFEQASAAAVTADSGTVLIAGADKVWQVGLGAGNAEQLKVAGSGSLTLLRSRDSYLLSARSDEPAWMFVRDSPAPAVYFVPALVNELPVESGAPAK